jgi:ABC-2 type transport system ATP-binding protein
MHLPAGHQDLRPWQAAWIRRTLETPEEEVPVERPVIRTESLSKRYGPIDALTDLNLEVAPGEVVGYLGPNGAGKTTTIRLLLGLARPTAGRAELFGLDSRRQAVDAHRHLAYVPGEASLWPSLTGAETLHLLGRVQGRVDSVYRDQLIERFDFDPSRKVRTYSKGNRQKLVLIAALMSRAELLLLDEPTSGLDPLMEQAFRASVHEARAEGQTIFLSSHILSEVEALCDRVGILREGRLVELGTLAEMRHLSSLTLEATFEGPLPDVSRVPGVGAVHIEGPVLHCQVRGSLHPLLAVLAQAGAQKVLSREPSLEELFLAHYGTGADTRDTPARAR